MNGISRDTLRRLWPWFVLAMTIWPAFWHTVDFPEDADREYPGVLRPTFSKLPPPVYRLAEPGDTIDRIGIYTSSVAIVLAFVGLWASARRGNPGLWPSALALAIAGFWYAANPGPTFDGWHGLGWSALRHPETPTALRLALGAAALILAAAVAMPLVRNWPRRRAFWRLACERHVAGLIGVALVGVAVRQVEIPGVEPAGYWPRWAFVWALVAFGLAMIRVFPKPETRSWGFRAGVGVLGASAWFALVVGGIWLTWYHRPLARLRAVVPGKIYISAMPTPRGLEIAQGRRHFKTIINLFPEDTAFRSPDFPAEVAFARSHGIHYVVSPSDVASSDAFLDETLRLARNPAAWPILVHCHACMDRTPAWMGIYRFVVQGRPLDEIMREIEGHRGYRPKASVTLLYNRVLQPRAPEHYAADPAAALLQRSAEGTRDPYEDELRAELESRGVNPDDPPPISPHTFCRHDPGAVCR